MAPEPETQVLPPPEHHSAPLGVHCFLNQTLQGYNTHSMPYIHCLSSSWIVFTPAELNPNQPTSAEINSYYDLKKQRKHVAVCMFEAV